MLKKIMIASAFGAAWLNAAPALHRPLPPCVLDDGGLEDGKPWAPEFGNLTTVLFYVDPDHRDDNQHVGDALKASTIPPEKIRSYAVINYAATWLPNVFIQNAIETKQRQFTMTTFVKDLRKKLISCWDLADDSSNVLLIGRDRMLKFYHAGKVSADQLQDFLNLVRSDVN